jgi:thiopurine S-methyltransferase
MTFGGRPFWAERWGQQRIGFHEGQPNDLLVAHIDALDQGRGKQRILAPLAGKAEDLWWLAARGHEVVGVEFVASAVEAFFAERGLALRDHEQRLGPFTAYVADGVTMLCEDFFAITPDAIGTFDAIYDRAALIALDPSDRARYVASCRALAKPSAPTFLISLTYDQSRAPGPPWSIDGAEIEALYGSARVLQTRTVEPPTGLAKAGVQTIEETAYLVE